ncbi:MAG: hypothetical protein KZQ83_20565 [gamma proteobacterium symbiont of Taylorina sp.]|nr:hypothetical protein [gamma proteobacterium symbiont of Taylorina sp.]
MELGNRQGQRTDKELRENLPEVKGKRTRDIAAKKSGLGSGKTFESAKKVTETGSPELVKKMDKYDLVVSDYLAIIISS